MAVRATICNGRTTRWTPTRVELRGKGTRDWGKLNLHDLQRPVGQLSGGEKRRVALAQVLLESPDFLILDEPTNHLDLDMIAWLEQRLASIGTTLLMVTHDRYFLENVCDRILELEDHTLHSYHGNFSYFLEKRAERRANAQAVQERARSHMKRELEWVRATPSARTTKSKSRLDRFQDLKKAAAKRLQEDPLHLTVIPERMGGKVVELHKVKRASTNVCCLRASPTISNGENASGSWARTAPANPACFNSSWG